MGNLACTFGASNKFIVDPKTKLIASCKVPHDIGMSGDGITTDYSVDGVTLTTERTLNGTCIINDTPTLDTRVDCAMKYDPTAKTFDINNSNIPSLNEKMGIKFASLDIPKARAYDKSGTESNKSDAEFTVNFINGYNFARNMLKMMECDPGSNKQSCIDGLKNLDKIYNELFIISQENTDSRLKTTATTAPLPDNVFTGKWTNQDIIVCAVLASVFLGGAVCVAYGLKSSSSSA